MITFCECNLRRNWRVTAIGFGLLTGTTIVHTGEPLRIELDADLLSIQADAIPLDEVVIAIGQRAGFEIIRVGHHGTPLSMSITSMPLQESLEKLLSQTNSVIFYAAGKTAEERVIHTVWLLGSPESTTETDTQKWPAIREFGDVEPLAVANDLQHADAGVRSLEVLSLANAEATEQVLEALAQLLVSDVDALVRTRAAMALGELGDTRSVPALEATLSDANGTVQASAISALGQIGGESATTALGQFLLHATDMRQRVNAARSLARQGTAIARQYLDPVADDPDPQIRAAAEPTADQTRTPAVEIPKNSENWGSDSLR